MNQLKYRRDIDGLRAIAVLSVILFHINHQWLPSGFLGVDIFFVISGYLITSIIYYEMMNQTFSFEKFYIRRIKRILPVFFVVLLFGIGVCSYVYTPKDFADVILSALWAVFFGANFYFSKGANYFDISTDEKPFLHLWSLSIEEQFYFIFPIFLLLMVRFTSTLRHNIHTLIVLLSLIILIAFSFIDLGSTFGIWRDSYYLPHLRFIEMMTGSLLALIICCEKRIVFEKFLPYVSPLILLLLLSIFFLKNIFVPPYFPGIYALVPSLLTAALIYSSRRSLFTEKILSNPLMVWIGKLSYSLYLWHWVILAIMRYIWQENELPWEWIVIALALTFTLSILTYYLIEQPLRIKKYSFKQSFLYYYSIPSILVIFTTVKMIYFNNEKQNFEEQKFPLCYQNIENSCFAGNTNNPANILVVGDSHTLHLIPFIDKIGKKEGWNAQISPAVGCPFLFDYSFEGGNQERNEFCKKRNDYIEENLYHKYSIIIISNFWSNTYYNNDPNYLNKIDLTLEKLSKENKQIYLLNSSHQLRYDPNREHFLNQKGIALVNRTEIFDPQSLQKVKAIQSKVKQYSNLHWIDLSPLLRKLICSSNTPIFEDAGHLNTSGAEKLAEEFMKKEILIK